MITREDLNVAVGTFVDEALEAIGLPTERRKSDDPAPIDRRSLQIQLEELQIEPMGSMRQLTQDITIYFYPSDDQRYRDEIWTAANGIEAALTAPLVVGDATLYATEDGVTIDMTTEVMEIRFSLIWIEVADDHEDYELIETLEMEELNYGITS